MEATHHVAEESCIVRPYQLDIHNRLLRLLRNVTGALNALAAGALQVRVIKTCAILSSSNRAHVITTSSSSLSCERALT